MLIGSEFTFYWKITFWTECTHKKIGEPDVLGCWELEYRTFHLYVTWFRLLMTECHCHRMKNLMSCLKWVGASVLVSAQRVVSCQGKRQSVKFFTSLKSVSHSWLWQSYQKGQGTLSYLNVVLSYNDKMHWSGENFSVIVNPMALWLSVTQTYLLSSPNGSTFGVCTWRQNWALSGGFNVYGNQPSNFHQNKK